MITNIDYEREIYHNMLDRLVNEYNFAKFVVHSCYADDFRYEWNECDKAADEIGFWVSSGATRVVFGLDRDSEIVIKIQLDTDTVDYSKREAEVYAEAKEEGLEEFFAESVPLFKYHFEDGGMSKDITIYAMERIECGYDDISDDSYNYHYAEFCREHDLDPADDESRDAYYDDRNYDEADEEGMVVYAVSTWGGKWGDYAELFKFMREHYINDMHAGNWGYRGGKLVMCDYGGFGHLECRRMHY